MFNIFRNLPVDLEILIVEVKPPNFINLSVHTTFCVQIGGKSRVSCECVVSRGQSSFVRYEHFARWSGRYEHFVRWSGRYEHFARFWRQGTIDCMPLYAQTCIATFSARLDTNNLTNFQWVSFTKKKELGDAAFGNRAFYFENHLTGQNKLTNIMWFAFSLLIIHTCFYMLFYLSTKYQYQLKNTNFHIIRTNSNLPSNLKILILYIPIIFKKYFYCAH